MAPLVSLVAVTFVIFAALTAATNASASVPANVTVVAEPKAS